MPLKTCGHILRLTSSQSPCLWHLCPYFILLEYARERKSANHHSRQVSGNACLLFLFRPRDSWCHWQLNQSWSHSSIKWQRFAKFVVTELQVVTTGCRVATDVGELTWPLVTFISALIWRPIVSTCFSLSRGFFKRCVRRDLRFRCKENQTCIVDVAR